MQGLNLLEHLDRSALRILTSCGSGKMVWRVWGYSSDTPQKEYAQQFRQQAPVLLLHGAAGSWSHFVRNILPLVEAGHVVLAPDLPGFGESATPPVGSDADAVVPPLLLGLSEVMQTLTGVRRPIACHWTGFSFGSLVAGLAAMQQPQWFTTLVLVGAPALGVRSTREVPLMGWRHFTQEKEREQAHKHNLRVMMLHTPQALDALALAIQSRNAPRDRMLYRKLSGTPALAQALTFLSQRSPALNIHAIYGEHDALYVNNMEAAHTAMRKAAPHLRSWHVVPTAGHWVQFEQAQAFNELLMLRMT